jgi:PAS domain-containing protein
MLPITAVADEILQTVLNLVLGGDRKQLCALEACSAAIYVTDIDGFITYFNRACVDFAGRVPLTGQDRWCVTWKLYTNEGSFLPHDQCPMAVAIRTRQAVRGITAVAERPDGSRVNFLPFPTPIVREGGEFLGAANMLIDIADAHELTSKQLGNEITALRSAVVEHALSALTIEDINRLMDEYSVEMARQHPRIVN